MSSSIQDTVLRTSTGTPYRLLSGPEMVADLHGTMRGSVDFLVGKAFISRFLRDCIPTPRRLADNSPVVVLPRKFVPYLPSCVTALSFHVSSQTRDKPLDLFNLEKRANLSEDTYDANAVVTIDFGTCREAVSTNGLRSDQPETFLEPAFNINVEALSINPNKNIRTGTSSGDSGEGAESIKDLTTPIVRIIPIVEETYTWNWALDPDFDLIFSRLGHVNQSIAKFLRAAPVETVMFLGLSGKLEYRWTFDGGDALQNLTILPPTMLECWRLDYRFARRYLKEETSSGSGLTTIGWNHIYDPDKQEWRRLFRQVGNNRRPLYTKSNFTDLFRCRVLQAS